MEDRVAGALADVLRRMDSGETLSPAQILDAYPDCGAEIAEALALSHLATEAAVPARLGAFRVLRALGRGAMGTVHLGIAEVGSQFVAPGTLVALKSVHGGLAAHESFSARFLREVEAGREVRHPNVVRTLDLGTDERGGRFMPYVVLEYVEGESFADLLARLGRLPEAMCRPMGRDVARGLAALHAAGVIHRDVKPANVLVTKDEVVKLTDFGVAWMADAAERASRGGEFAGSLRYAAPEQALGSVHDLDGRADLYALGVTLYELATGVPPTPDGDLRRFLRRALDEPAPAPSSVEPRLSPFFDAVVATLLAPDPGDRFASAEEVALVLDRGEESEWWVRRNAESRTRIPRIDVARPTPAYGIDGAVAALRAALDSANGGDGRAVLVEGEAGAGKTRLLDEFLRGAAAGGTDVDVRYGSFPPGGRGTAAEAFAAALRAGCAPGRMEETVRSWLPDMPRFVCAFTALIEGAVPPPGVEPLSRDATHAGFAAIARVVGRERTTVLVIDDLHFAPDDGRAIFVTVARALAGHRVLLLGTVRPEGRGAWTTQFEALGHASTIRLGGLAPSDVGSLLAASTRSEDLSRRLGPQVAELSGGNPFFVLAILDKLREDGFLARRPDLVWTEARALGAIELPSTVRSLVSLRLERLDPEDRRILGVAACCGVEFDPKFVAAAVGANPLAVARRLAVLESGGGLVHATGERFAFEHHQVLAATLDRLSATEGESHHASIASALEAGRATGAADPGAADGDLCARLSEHWIAAGQGRRALPYLDRALEHLERGYRNDAAVRLLGGVLAVEGLVGGLDRCRMLLRRASRLDLLGRGGDESATLREAVSLADAEGDDRLRAQSRSTLATLMVREMRCDEACTLLADAGDLARRAGDRGLEAVIEGNLGAAECTLERFEAARERFERQLTIARELGDARSEVLAAGNLGVVLNEQGRFEEACAWFERALVLARGSGNLRSEAMAIGNLGNALQALGRFEEARSSFERRLELAREMADLRGEIVATGNLGNLFGCMGLLAEARAQHEKQLALAIEAGDVSHEANARLNLGRTLLQLGRASECEEQCSDAAEVARAMGARKLEAVCLRVRAEAADVRGAFGEAERGLREACAIFTSLGVSDEEATSALVALGALLRRDGRTEEARSVLESARAQATSGGVPGPRIDALVELAALGAWDLASAASAVESEAPRLGQVSLMSSWFTLWEASGERRFLERAKQSLDHLVAHAPSDRREAMIEGVPLHRAIDAAWRGDDRSGGIRGRGRRPDSGR